MEDTICIRQSITVHMDGGDDESSPDWAWNVAMGVIDDGSNHTVDCSHAKRAWVVLSRMGDDA